MVNTLRRSRKARSAPRPVRGVGRCRWGWWWPWQVSLLKSKNCSVDARRGLVSREFCFRIRDMDLSAQAAGIGALADDTRRALYEYVSAQPEPVGREQAAAALGLALHNVSFHLDRLVAEGLLEVEYRRLSGKSRARGRAAEQALPPGRPGVRGVAAASPLRPGRRHPGGGGDAGRRGRAAGAGAARGGPRGGLALGAGPSTVPTRPASLAGAGPGAGQPGVRASGPTTTSWCCPTAPSTRWPRSTRRWCAGSTRPSCRGWPTASGARRSRPAWSRSPAGAASRHERGLTNDR